MAVAGLYRCIFGPRLNRMLHIDEQLARDNGGPDPIGRVYRANMIEYWSDGFIRLLSVLWSLSVFTCPLIVPVIYYKRDGLTRGRIVYLLKFSVVFGVAFVGSFVLRGVGRLANPDYRAFLASLANARLNIGSSAHSSDAKYDFSFWAWPIEFRWSEGDSKKPLIASGRPSSKRSTVFQKIRALPCQVISYFVATIIGRRLLYPGSLQILQAAVDPHLTRGRHRLLKEVGGERFKLLTRDSNELDVLVVDRRKVIGHEYRDVLVICCEGNAGFYEMGIMDVPLRASYSVLGWNHPGFAGSTGEPFPEQELNAIDVVVQFAVHRLGFPLEDIVLYAWSIGGYTATWAAAAYPEIQSLVLDATFDDILPLALAQMPACFGPIVTRTMRDYLNLTNVDHLCQYPGPVLLIRRTKDEVITTNQSLGLRANRGNFLLTKFLQHRYPIIYGDGDGLRLLQTWLRLEEPEQILLRTEHGVDEELCETLAFSCYVEDNGMYPSSLGDGMPLETVKQMALFLVSKHMSDFESTHCQPLSVEKFTVPWLPTERLSRNSSPFEIGEIPNVQ